MTAERSSRIRERLIATLEPSELIVADESDRHVGHPGARDGRGHFRVHLVSRHFHGQARLRRHRLVYEALDDMMKTDIHALSIEALTPEEAKGPDASTA
ncbi:BolA family transcriptional regulator [soil metagenome]